MTKYFFLPLQLGAIISPQHYNYRQRIMFFFSNFLMRTENACIPLATSFSQQLFQHACKEKLRAEIQRGKDT